MEPVIRHFDTGPERHPSVEVSCAGAWTSTRVAPRSRSHCRRWSSRRNHSASRRGIRCVGGSRAPGRGRRHHRIGHWPCPGERRKQPIPRELGGPVPTCRIEGRHWHHRGADWHTVRRHGVDAGRWNHRRHAGAGDSGRAVGSCRRQQRHADGPPSERELGQPRRKRLLCPDHGHVDVHGPLLPNVERVERRSSTKDWFALRHYGTVFRTRRGWPTMLPSHRVRRAAVRLSRGRTTARSKGTTELHHYHRRCQQSSRRYLDHDQCV